MLKDIGVSVNEVLKRAKLPKSEVKGRAANVIAGQHLRPLFDLSGICRRQFMELGFEVEHYERLFEVEADRKLTWSWMLSISEKVWHLTRSISAREIKGFGRSWNYPPERFMSEPVPNGTRKNLHDLITGDTAIQFFCTMAGG